MGTVHLVVMIVGFGLAGYSIVANDAIQTLGTFLSSNSKRPWWLLWLYACTILTVVLVYSYVAYSGDVTYGRLDSFPEVDLTWMYLIPPLVILILTRLGVPVSTTFLVLTLFAPQNMGSMLIKSLLGYAVAFFVAIILYRFVIRRLTEYFDRTQDLPVKKYWYVLQWCSTGFLWAQWLVQDLANIYVYLPRHLSPTYFIATVVFLLILHAFIFYTSGGEIQKIVTSKTGTADIRAATIIDFMYGFILMVFKEASHMPMSTTWVFRGLLAGREFAIATHMYQPSVRETAKVVARDAGKAAFGLAISVALAAALPWLNGLITY